MSGGGFFGQQSQEAPKTGSQNNGNVGDTARAVRTLMLRQIEDAISQGDGKILVDTHPASQGVLCVLLKNVTDSNNNAKTLDVSDTTGEAELRYRKLDPEASADNLNDYLNTYVRLYGKFRTFNDNISFDVFRVEPVENAPDDVIYHEIEAAREWYHYMDLIPISQSLDASENVSQNESNNNNNNNTTPPKNQSLFIDDTVQDEERIHDALKENDNSGKTLQQLVDTLGIDSDRAYSTLRKLVGNGMIVEMNGEYFSSY